MRYKIDAMRELATLENRLRSQRKTANNTPSRATASICDAVISSLEKKIAALQTEILALPEKPQPQYRPTSGNFPIHFRTTDLTDAEKAAMELPDFLRRSA